MPVLRTELLRSVYRRYFTLSGRIFGRLAGARELTEDVLKEWFYYFFQCTECRRCSVFCPYGIDTCEMTMMARELLNLLGLNINWIVEPASNCYRTGNHLGIPPNAFKSTVDFAVDEIKEVTGIQVEVPINERGQRFSSSLPLLIILQVLTGIPSWVISSYFMRLDWTTLGAPMLRKGGILAFSGAL